jgi:hypothetical protein
MILSFSKTISTIKMFLYNCLIFMALTIHNNVKDLISTLDIVPFISGVMYNQSWLTDKKGERYEEFGSKMP